MMKKSQMKSQLIIVLALMLVFAAALSACDGGSGGKTEIGGASESAGGSGGDAYSLYSAANKALQDAEGYQMDMAITGKVGTGGQDLDVDTTSHMEVNDPVGNIEMLMTQKTKTLGQEMESTSYMKDGYLYSETLGMKTKMKLDASAMASQTNSFIDFPKDAIVDQNVTDVDGGKQLAMTVKGDAVSSYIMKQANLGDEVAGITDGLSFGDMVITAVVDAGGNMIECSIKISMKMNLSDIETTGDAADMPSSMTTDMSTTMSNIKIGKVDIKVPADLDSYQELNLDNLMDTGAGTKE